jgi:predicted protein tyrosine phosphatase
MLISYETMSCSGNLNCSKDAAPWTQVEKLKINTHILIMEGSRKFFVGNCQNRTNYDLKTDLKEVCILGVPDTYTYLDPHTRHLE